MNALQNRPRYGSIFILLLLLMPAVAMADVMTTAPAGQETVDAGSTAWMLMSSALVLFMVPGLALFYGGMVRAKNVLNLFLCCMVTIGVIGLLWVIVGYALSFGATSLITVGGGGTWSWLGWDSSLLFLRGFDAAHFNRLGMTGDTSGAIVNGVPELVFVMFQGKFAIITPALIVGAIAERVRFGPLVLFMILWSLIVYSPVAHWVWNVNGWLFQYGVLDFAGGTVVHVLAGASALAVCMVVGPRLGYGKVPMPPHSLGLTLIGAGLLWFGWFGFNAGSAIALPKDKLPVAGAYAALALTNTQIAAAAAATVWMLVEWAHAGKPTILGFASGMVAGLVVITPCAGFVEPTYAIFIGAAGGAVCYLGCRIKNIIKVDDSLDCFGVHGVGGALGAIMVGLFAFWPDASRGALVEGGTGFQVVKQAIGVGVAAVFGFVVSYILALAIHKTIGLRVKPDDEIEGLDIVIHGESGYNLTEPLGGYVYQHEDAPNPTADAAMDRK